MRSALAAFLSLDRRLWLLALARSINTMGFSLVMPFMGLYLVEQRGASGATFGLIYLVAGLVAAGSQAISGELSDRLGRRRQMLLALGTRSGVMALLGWAVLRDAPIPGIAALVIVNAFVRAQFDPAASAAVADLSAPETRVSAFGLQRMGVNLGWAVGPALGGLLAVGGYGRVFFLAVPATLLAMIAVAQVKDAVRARPPPEPRLTLARAREALAANRPFFAYLVLVLAGSVLTVQMFSVLSLYASGQLGLSKAEVGLLYTVNGLGVLALQVPALALIAARGMGRSLVLGALIYAAAFLGIGAASSFGTLALAVAFLTVGEVVFAPALSDAAATLGDPRRMGRAFGLFGLTQQLGISLAPLLGGLLFDHLASRHLVLWGIVAAGMLAVAGGYAAFLRRVSLEPGAPSPHGAARPTPAPMQTP